MCNPIQPIRAVTAEVGNPIVVHAAIRHCEFRIFDFPFPDQPERWIEDCGIDTIFVQDLDASFRVIGPFRSIDVAKLLGEGDFAGLAKSRRDT